MRFADHANTSSSHLEPNINCVGRCEVTLEELTDLSSKVDYPRLCKKTPFAMHCGLTTPKLRKLLPPDCYEEVCEDPFNYPNTSTEYVVVATALEVLSAAGITKRYPVAQERWTEEDYDGRMERLSRFYNA